MKAFALLELSEFKDFQKIVDESRIKVSFEGEEREETEGIISNIRRETEQKALGYELAIRSQFNLLLIKIFRKMSFKPDNVFRGVSDKLLTYIAKHCHEKLVLKDIADMCAYNPSYFSRIFKEYTGETFTDYLKKVRIEKASELLRSTDRKVTDILYEVGYSDRTKFFLHFKSVMGVTPLKYRENQK